jgi:hypothetical protein
MLSLNKQQDSNAYWQDVWKILVYDSYCRDILATLMKVGDLRQYGITLHMYSGDHKHIVICVAVISFLLFSEEKEKTEN